MPEKLHLDDLHVGQTFQSRGIKLEPNEVEEFASRFDPQFFHLDADQAKISIFGGLAASGWHTGSVTQRLLVEAMPLACGIIGAGVELSWPRPTRPGDTLRVKTEVLEIHESKSKPDRGIVKVKVETFNQNDEASPLTGRLFVFRKPT